MDLRVLNPVATVKRNKFNLAPRLRDLSGKTVGLYWNGKPGGDMLLKHTSDLLTPRYPGITFKDYVGAGGAAMRQSTPQQIDDITKECAAVIASTSD
jgi:hypothetical protein